MSNDTEVTTLTTSAAVELIANERAPRYPNGKVNRRVVCTDGYRVSVQASAWHYSIDSAGRRPFGDDDAAHPFVSFEVGNPDADPTPAEVWDERESGGVWAFVPRGVVADLLEAHGGAVAWEATA